MIRDPYAVQGLISLPPAAVERARRTNWPELDGWYADCDPEGCRLGSGGGTAYLLVRAWQATGQGLAFHEWLRASRKLIVHGGGESRRLPAYAALGKPLIPIPVLRWSWGQTLRQTLLDLQAPAYRRLLQAAPPNLVAMVASGDVALLFGDPLPAIPEADVVFFGMQVAPEIAVDFGVLYVDPECPTRLVTFVQKPAVEEIRVRSAANPFLVDTGMWMLSERAVDALLDRSGWDEAACGFRGGAPRYNELYAGFGLALGAAPARPDSALSALTCAVVALPDAQFYHLGASRQLIESVWALQNAGSPRVMVSSSRAHPDQITQNAVFDGPSLRPANHTIWVENAVAPLSWRLSHDHVLTGAPPNDWSLWLDPGVCLDFVPVDEALCIRAYGIDDTFSGAIGAPSTAWFGRPAAEWFAVRDINAARAGIDPGADIQRAPIFPVLAREEIDDGFIAWLTEANPMPDPAQAERWVRSRRASAEELGRCANLDRVVAQRDALRLQSLRALYDHRATSVFYRLDLEQTARLYAAGGQDPPPAAPDSAVGPLAAVHDHMWRAAVYRHRGDERSGAEEEAAFACLREAILGSVLGDPVRPALSAQSDQIVWARSPVRFDLAGGWTDTPPYCLQHGGSVVNVAVDLNGQPPVQVFARPCDQRRIVIRSIDLGAEQVVETYEALSTYARPGSEFALAKAALALAGFLPQFCAGPGHRSLQAQLDDFGGGIEVSLLAAVPQGSGLGVSSVLAATLLRALSDLCGLHWDDQAVIARTLALEQMLTTGGGWQDQAGGVLRGIKLLQTQPGLDQTIAVRWLPDYLFADGVANRRILLYYTGLTRMARNILQEIVRGMFLNAADRLAILREIGANAADVADAIQRQDWEGLCAGVRRTWTLKQRLDAGTNPPPVQAILDPLADYLCAAELPGAGGGGYLLMFARDEEAAARVRRHLLLNPPNDRARFVDLSVSRTGLEITRS